VCSVSNTSLIDEHSINNTVCLSLGGTILLIIFFKARPLQWPGSKVDLPEGLGQDYSSSFIVVCILINDPDINGNNFPGGFWPRRYYVDVTINGQVQKTLASEKSNAPTWNESFFLWVHMYTYKLFWQKKNWILNGDVSYARITSVLKIRVFAASKRTPLQDSYIGEMEETIQSLLNDRGHCNPFFHLTNAKCTFSYHSHTQ